MDVLKCKMCGGNLELEDDSLIGTCSYCGTKQTLPKREGPQKVSRFNRANHLRMTGEYDKAQSMYEEILADDDSDSEAYWGVVLCRYGIEYVEDPVSKKRIPTCHRTQYDSILSDADYLAAVKSGSDEQKEIYKAEAQNISAIQKGILKIVAEEEPYDVFICYKETDENGKRTRDSVIANDIYKQLTDEGFKVFYALITLEDKLGQEYEPCIFAALNSAKVMLVIGTKQEYFNAVWVKNEWSRYMQIIKKDRSKLLIPCYRDMDAYDLPDEFARFQAQDMSKIGFINDITRGISKVIKPAAKQKSEVAYSGGQSSKAHNLAELGFSALSAHNSAEALDDFKRALEEDTKLALAYWGRLLCEKRVYSDEELAQKLDFNLASNPFCKNALACANAQEKARFEKVIFSCKEKAQFESDKEALEEEYRGKLDELELVYGNTNPRNIDDANTKALFTAFNEKSNRYNQVSKATLKKKKIKWAGMISVVLLCLTVLYSLIVLKDLSKVGAGIGNKTFQGEITFSGNDVYNLVFTKNYQSNGHVYYSEFVDKGIDGIIHGFKNKFNEVQIAIIILSIAVGIFLGSLTKRIFVGIVAILGLGYLSLAPFKQFGVQISKQFEQEPMTFFALAAVLICIVIVYMAVDIVAYVKNRRGKKEFKALCVEALKLSAEIDSLEEQIKADSVECMHKVNTEFRETHPKFEFVFDAPDSYLMSYIRRRDAETVIHTEAAEMPKNFPNNRDVSNDEARAKAEKPDDAGGNLFDIFCPTCGERITVNSSFDLENIVCPTCGNHFGLNK